MPVSGDLRVSRRLAALHRDPVAVGVTVLFGRRVLEGAAAALAEALPSAVTRVCDSVTPEDLRGAQVLVPAMMPVGRGVLEAAPHLALVHQWGAGLDTVDVAAASELGVIVANVPSGLGNAREVAEWCVMVALVLSRELREGVNLVRMGSGWGRPEGRSLGELSMGVIGLGGVGQALVHLLAAFGAPVWAVTRRPDAVRGTLPGLVAVEDVAHICDVLALCDCVFVTVPLTAETHHLLSDHELNSIRQGGLLVNASRGPVVDTGALLGAIRSGRLAGAALDVFETEPLPPTDELLQDPRILCTPHVAGMTQAARRRIARVVAGNISRFFDEGLVPATAVNPDVDWSSRLARPPGTEAG